MFSRCVVLLTLLIAALPVLAATYPDAPPNDPNYSTQTNVWDYIPMQTYPLATDEEGAAGMSIEKAWRDPNLAGARTGRPDVIVAYLEGGLNLHLGAPASDLTNKIVLNRAEIEGSARYQPGDYEDNGDPWYNAADFPNVPDANGNGYVDAEDVAIYYVDAVDNDGNGYVDDIISWDFYNGQNDAVTLDAQYPHSDAQMGKAGAQADNGIGYAGMCPDCMILPVKVGAEALDRAPDLARGILYAIDRGAAVVTTENAALGYGTFEREVIEYAFKHDVLIAETSNDFDSTDHLGAMYWPHNIPGNGLVRDQSSVPVVGSSLPVDPSTAITRTFRVRSGETSWGPKAMLSVSTRGGSTSESTGTLGGVLGMLASAAKEFSPPGNSITAPEIIQTAIATASDIADSSEAKWPVVVGWDEQTGYGRFNVWKAMDAMRRQEIPPVAWFDAPEWFTLWDPTTTASLPIAGHVEARRSPSYSWKLEYGLGSQPGDDGWQTIGSGSGQTPQDGVLGNLDLSAIPTSFYSAAFSLSQRKELETAGQFTVTLKLTVTDAQMRTGVERRAILVRHDDSWFPGFPVRVHPQTTAYGSTTFSPGGESQPALVDLQGLGHLQLVYGDSDGYVHALDPLTRQELPGFPVTTDPVAVLRTHDAVSPRFESIPAPLAVGDLDHDGHLWIVASVPDGKVYIWNEHGERRAGWPRVLDQDVVKPSIPRAPENYRRPPTQGAFAVPTLYDLDGDGKLEIIQPGWDGYLHVWRGDDSDLSGWPVKVTLAGTQYENPPAGYVRIADDKLESAVAIADLDGDGHPEIVVRSQQNDSLQGGDIKPLGATHVHAYHADGSPVSGWPIRVPTVIMYYGSAQEFVTEGAEGISAADVDGDGIDEIAASGLFSPVTLYDGNGQFKRQYGPSPAFDPVALLNGLVSQQALQGQLEADVPVSFTTSGAFGKFGPLESLSYAQPGSGAASVALSLLFVGSGSQLRNFERAVDASTGVPLPGFPSTLQGLNFLGAPLFVDVDGDGLAEIVDGGDSHVLHAYTSAGAQAAGFPKYTSGWALWSPSAGDIDGDGKIEIVQSTREGYVFAWKTDGLAIANDQWWTYRHDEWRSGRYGIDTRPPGVIRSLVSDAARHSLSFVAPGDDWYVGAPASYRITRVEDPQHATTIVAHAAAGSDETIVAPEGVERGFIQAVDKAGNLGRKLGFAFSGSVPVDDVTGPTEPATGGTSQRFGGALSLGVSLLLLGLGVVRRQAWR